MIRVIGKKIALRIPKEGQHVTESGVVLPAGSESAVDKSGLEIIAVGPRVSRFYNVGDKVVLSVKRGEKITINGEKLLIISSDLILGKI